MSSVPDDLRAVIVCPRCRGELHDEPASLRCDTCRLRYRVNQGIPVLLVADAEKVDRNVTRD